MLSLFARILCCRGKCTCSCNRLFNLEAKKLTNTPEKVVDKVHMTNEPPCFSEPTNLVEENVGLSAINSDDTFRSRAKRMKSIDDSEDEGYKSQPPSESFV